MDRRAVAPRPRTPTARGAGLLLVAALAAALFPAAGPVGAASVTLAPEADATVEADRPTRNFGAAEALLADRSPAREAYLRFSVPPLAGPAASARLRLWVLDRVGNGPRVHSTGNDWDEAGITWANRPAAAGGAADDAGKLDAGSWVSFDVTSLVSGAGVVSFVLVPDSGDGVDFASREGSAHRPELIVEAAAGDPGDGDGDDGEGDDGDGDDDGGDGGGDGVPALFTPVADGYVEEDHPDDNFGFEERLKVEGGRAPDIEAHLRFAVDGLSGPVRRATLRLFVFNDTEDGPAVHPTAGGWTEEGLTWETRPAVTGPAVDDAGPVDDGWLELDVTGAFTGDGTWNLVLVSGSDDSLAVRSREAAADVRPQLVVETGEDTTTTTTSTTTTSTTSTTTTSSTTTTTTAPPAGTPAEAEADEPWLGLARVTTRTCAPGCVDAVYSLSVKDVDAADRGDQRDAFRFPPGGSATLRLEWERTGDGGDCDAGDPATAVEVSMRRPGGARIGHAVWTAELPGSCGGAVTGVVDFDDDPFDGDAGDAHHGVMEVYARLVGGADHGADTRGAPAAGGTADEPGRYARGHLVSGGVMVGWHESGDDAVAVTAAEAALGEPFGLIRAYSSRWRLPPPRVEDWMAEGKFVLWSVKPPRDAAGADDWTPVADGSEDAVIDEQVALLQSWAEEHGVQVGYIFQHEPHDDADVPGVVDDCELPGDSSHPCSGTPQEFIDAYERIRAIIADRGADRVLLTYTATLSRAGAVAPGSSLPGSGDEMTQGIGGESVLDYVDLLAHDSYNWYCFRSSCDWEFPDEFGMWGRGAALAATQGKPMILAETASHPGCPDATSVLFGCDTADLDALPSPDRDDWFRRIGEYFESDPEARRWIVGFAYYHSLHTHDWRFVGQDGAAAAGTAGWRDVFVTDSSANDGLGGHDYFAPYGFNNL